MNPQISILDGTVSLIHLPLDLYGIFLQPILRVLLPETQIHGDSVPAELEGLTADRQHGFLNISITPLECSIVCHTSWAKRIFEPVVRGLSKDASKTVSVSHDAYLVLSVISAGMDAASRVVDLTSPLAMAGIPIFFISTYYSDFILVPSKDRQSVVRALHTKGFEFSEAESSFVAPHALSHARGGSNGNDLPPPSTPPPSTVAELQVRTFNLLKKRNVVPYVQAGLQLVQCSGRETTRVNGEYSHRPAAGRRGMGSGYRQSWVDMVDTKLYTSLVSALVAQPKFLSITLTEDDAPSLLVDKSLLKAFGDSLVGDTDGSLVPIFLDLASLPLEATGIVSGVAGKLVEEMHMTESSELSYLSTARAGAVILSWEQSVRALDILQPLLTNE